MRSNKV